MEKNQKEAQWKQDKRMMILEKGFRLFAERGIENVTLPEIAEASNISRATIYRYYPNKVDLVIAVSCYVWEKYLNSQIRMPSEEEFEKISVEEFVERYLNSFLNLYKNHADILCFNYNFNSYLKHEKATSQQLEPFTQLLRRIRPINRERITKWQSNMNRETAETLLTVFFGSFHIMLAAVTRYAVGLVYNPVDNADPEAELNMLKSMFEEKLLALFATEKKPNA